MSPTTVLVDGAFADTDAGHGTTDVEEFIVDVLHRAHETALAAHAHDEARTILGVAQLFAEDLAKADPRFDPLRFVQAATGDAA